MRRPPQIPTPRSVLPRSSIVRHITAGAYESPRGANSTATLRLEPLTYNAACDVKWLDADLKDRTNDTSFIVLRHLYITGAAAGLQGGRCEGLTCARPARGNCPRWRKELSVRRRQSLFAYALSVAVHVA